MTALEGEWRGREEQSEAEHRRVAGECVASEKALAGALAATQERERRLVAAEESLSVRREAERREMAQRMSEAQHAVRRLQQECEHQLDVVGEGIGQEAPRAAEVLEPDLRCAVLAPPTCGNQANAPVAALRVQVERLGPAR